MTAVSLEQAFQIALDHHRRQDLDTAEAIYRQIIQALPQHANSQHLLGVVCLQRGHATEALPHFDAAVALMPENADFHANRAECLRRLGQFTAAIEAFLHTLQLAPAHPAACNNLAITYNLCHRFGEAIAILQPLLQQQPDYVQGHNNLAIALRGAQRLEEALQHAQTACRLAPDAPEVLAGLGALLLDLDRASEALPILQHAVAQSDHLVDSQLNLANALARLAQFGEAEQRYQLILARWPEHTATWNNLGALYRRMGHPAEAAQCLQRALMLDPESIDARNNLGTVLRDEYRLCEAETVLLEALARAPDHADVCCNLGNVCELLGRPEQAVGYLRKALVSNPTNWRAHSNLLFSLNYLDNLSSETLREEHLAWNRHALPLLPARSIGRRPWRVGLVSPDFRRHPVGFFLQGILPHVDRNRLSLHGYSDVQVDDEITCRLRSATETWHDIRADSDAELAQRIADDQIDILIDLAGHGDRHRLRMFSARPAPRQLSWPGYFATTGLTTMDAILGDPWCTPPEFDGYFVERVLRLPHTRLCYQPPMDTPTPQRLPGPPTYGSFNTLAKLTPTVIATWAKLLLQTPHSQLFLKALGLRDPDTQQRLVTAFSRHGVEPERLRLEGPSSHQDLLRCYGEIDVALDPFPFTGGLTTFEALWMGVPLVTMIGQSLVGRQGYSALKNLGATWAAHHADEYIDIARRLLECRTEQDRSQQQQRMADSPLCDGRGFAKDWGELLDRWCLAD